MQLMSGLGNFAGKAGPLAMLPIGILQNIMAGRKQQDLMNTVMAQEKATQAKLTPQAIASGTAQLEQPLGLALQHNVGNGVQADLAQRGLAQSPGIYTEAMAQALAPYAMQNHLAALKAYLESTGEGHLQFPAWFKPTQGMDMTGIIRMLMQNGSGGSSGGSGGGGMDGFTPSDNGGDSPWDFGSLGGSE